MSEKDKVTYESGPLVMHTHPVFSTVTIDGLTKLANDLIIQNTALRNRLDAAETQRDELLNVLIEVDEALYCASEWEIPIMLPTRVKEAIAKAKGE